MELILDILQQNLVELITVLGGGGLLFYRQEKQKKTIDNISATNQEWQNLCKSKDAQIESYRQQLVKKDERLDDLYRERKAEREESARILQTEREESAESLDKERELRMAAEQKAASLTSKLGLYQAGWCKKSAHCPDREPKLEELINLASIEQALKD